MAWFESRLGEKEADALRLRAQKPTKIDLKEIRKSLKEEMNKLKAKYTLEESQPEFSPGGY